MKSKLKREKEKKLGGKASGIPNETIPVSGIEARILAQFEQLGSGSSFASGVEDKFFVGKVNSSYICPQQKHCPTRHHGELNRYRRLKDLATDSIRWHWLPPALP